MDPNNTARRTADHTPTPWSVLTWVDGNGWPVYQIEGVHESPNTQEQNRLFIERAVNSHDALVAACKEAREFLEDGYPLENISPQEANLREQLESALALAELH